MPDKKIALFIDDDEKFLAALAHMVEHPSFEIQTQCVANGYQAVDGLLRAKPDVVFIDFNIPRANGSQVVPIVKSVEGFEDLPVYFLTAYSKDAIASFMKHFEFEGILEKDGHFVDEILKILDELSANPCSEPAI